MRGSHDSAQMPADTTETVVLLVSELVTNAVTVTTVPASASTEPLLGGSIVQTLRRQPGRVVVEVSDSDPRPPVLTEVGTGSESGRGLMLVQALSKEWSYAFMPSGGKTVYCAVSTSDPEAEPTEG